MIAAAIARIASTEQRQDGGAGVEAGDGQGLWMTAAAMTSSCGEPRS